MRSILEPWANFQKASWWYDQIISDFGFNRSADIQAREILYNYRHNFDPTPIINEMRDKLYTLQPLFFGAGPNLILHLTQLSVGISAHRHRYFVVAADGAAIGLETMNIIPDLIVSDLDGLDNEDIIRFSEAGCIFALHGHGDNLDRLRSLEKFLRKSHKVIVTTQVESHFPVINPGGFTDGDRGIYLCHHLSAADSEFWLFGYDYGELIGPYSKKGYSDVQSMTEIKRKKLNYCKALIDDLANSFGRRVVYFNSHPVSDQKIRQKIR